MRPGDPSIRKTFDKICPRIGGEQIPAWLSRVARCLGLSVKRVNSLYYDRRCELSDEEGQVLRKHLGTSVPTITIDNQNLKDLNDKLQAQLLEAKKKQEYLDGQIQTMVSGFRALCSALETGSNMGRS